jgi:hypothetical protein
MSLHKMLRAAAGYQAPAPANTDPQFNYVSMLLHGDGTNGSQNNTFVDSSTNNFTITRNGNTTQGSLSPYGSMWSNYFDGNGDGLNMSANAAFDFGTGDLTIESWIYLAGNSPVDGLGRRYANIFSYSTTSALGAFSIMGNSSTTGTGFEFYNGSQVISASGTIPQNQWLHIAVTRASGSVRFFVNGVQFGSTQSFNFAFGSSSTAPQLARTLTTGYTFDLNGYMSNVRIVKGTALYTSNFTPSTTPLTAVSGTSLLTCQSNRFIDNSANNFTITPNGDVRVTKEAPFLPTAAYSTSVIGGSGYFDGNGDYLEVPDNSAFSFGSGDFTIEAWIYPTAYAAQDNDGNYTAAIYTHQQSFPVNSQSALFYLRGTASSYTKIAFHGFSSSTSTLIEGNYTFALNTWAHVAVVRNGNNIYLYVNGTQVNSTTAFTITLQDSTVTPKIGAAMLYAGYNYYWYFPGYVSNFRIVKGTAVYTSNFTPPTAPLTAITNTSLLLNFTNAGIFDNAAENNLETVGNAQISTSVKKYGTGSLAFDGTGDWLLVPDNTNLQLGTGNFTVEAWVYLSATGSARGLVGKGTSTTGWLLSTNSSDQIVFTYGTTTLTSSSALSANTWTHVAVVREGTGTNQTKIYIGGSNVATGTVSTDFNQTSVMYVGADRTGGSALNGYIDDLRITKGYARYTANFTPPTAAFPDQ